MGFDAFLKIDGIKGESQDAKHRGEIDVMSFSWGMAQAGAHGVGGGGGAGKVKVFDMSFHKTTDASSPLLFLKCASGAHIKEANFVVRKAGGAQLEYLKIKLTDVLVSSYKPGGAMAASQEMVAPEGGGGSPGGPPVLHPGASPPPMSPLGGALFGASVAVGSSDPISRGTGVVSMPAGGGAVQPVDYIDSIPTEQITLNFAAIEFSYQPQGADGKAQGGPIMAGWDVKQNKKV